MGGDANRPDGSALRVGAIARHTPCAAAYCDPFGTGPPNELPSGENPTPQPDKVRSCAG